MARDAALWIRSHIQDASRHLRRPENLAFLPALTLAAFWLGGEKVLVLTALGLPLLYLIFGAFHFGPTNAPPAYSDAVTGLALRSGLIQWLDDILRSEQKTGLTTACLVITIDEISQLIDRYGHAAHSEVLNRTADRMRGALRDRDMIARLEGDSFGVALEAVQRADLESILQLAARLQSAIAEPISLDGARLYMTASIGFCLASRSPQNDGSSLLEAAEIAAEDARRNGPGAIRAFSPELQRARVDRSQLRSEIEPALEAGLIRPHFQPQVSTDTGALTGFEALARWHHPERGVIPPTEFLPLIEEAGLAERLGEVILFQSFAALRNWDEAGLSVPNVAINFSQVQLRNPRLAEKLKWELDRFDLAPERLTVEILETVVAETDNDIIVHNISALAKLGCGIDLDDFGTGHASIANIRRFTVRRIKIDRSFVTHVDSDQNQQRMVAAILSMAEQLGLETIAEGVETTAEHAMVAQLGCGHVQGFCIARPMPQKETAAWIERHRSKLAATPQIGHRAC